MYGLVGLMTLSLLGIILLGIYYEMAPPQATATQRLKGIIATHLVIFVGAQIALVFLGMQEVMAAEGSGVVREVSVGMGLAMIGAGLPTALATIAAGLAVGPVGAASLAVIAEKPEVFGRTLVYLGLAEGIAIYGLVVTILMLGKL
jgi:V/A-type H+-transporting ATPase subunit K